jgi:glycosyltransferase involved in cell wall biosynthesis
MKYKVALIHNIISPYRIPLFIALANHPDIDLTVYYCAKTHKMRKWEINGITKYNYEVLSGFTIEFSSLIYHINPVIISKLINGKHDIVIVSGYSDFTSQVAFFVSRLLNKPTIIWTEGIATSESFLGKLLRPVTDLMVRKADSIIVPGTMSRNFIISKGARSSKIFMAPNIVDNDKFFKQSSEIREHIEVYKNQLNVNNKKIIIYVGRLVKEKGIEYLLSAYKKIKEETNDIGLIIVGDGDFRPDLEKICIDQGIRDVYFTGWLEDKKILYYSISDIFIFPTLRDVWGLATNEAMCCNLPVIVTKAAGCAQDMIVPGENGYIVDPANSEQLYLAVKDIIFNDDKLKKMGNKSKEIIKINYNINNIIYGFTSAIKYSEARGKI